MILSKIDILGFKSFARKTELRFDGRITAVVGPNGCGKTNIVDALRWGLGEQRYSVLRADRMENVIFGGAQSSRPLGMAEVSITFDNSAHLLPIDYKEVVITRRLYRSGESEYLLNKSQVRLKDVHDLIMDTGIGTGMYSVIELKMVEDIISEKAEDRRKLIEEAAGVTKYKHRLKAAIRKLEATQQDLLRVNDIIGEIDRTVRSLGRQVQKARHYQVLEERLKAFELDRGGFLLRQYRNREEPLRAAIDDCQRRKEGSTTEISREEADLESVRLELTGREKAFVAAQEVLTALTETLHRGETDLRVGRERIEGLKDRITRYGQEVENLVQRREEQKAHLERAAAEREALQVRITSTGRLFSNKKMELDVFQQGLNLKRLDLNKKKQEIIACLEEVSRLNNEETQHRARMDNNRGRLERLDEEDAAFQNDQTRVQESHTAVETDFSALSDQRSQIRTAMERAAEEIERSRKALEAAKEQYFRDQGELDNLQGRKSFIQHIIESREGMSDGSKRLLEQNPEGLVGVLADLIETAPEYRPAVEIGLGEAARYVVFSNFGRAVSALERLKRGGGGRAALVALDRLSKAPLPRPHPELPEGASAIGWADELVRFDPAVRSLAQVLLSDLLIVRDLDSAKRSVEAMAGLGIRAATLDGELVSDWGVLENNPTTTQDTSLVGRRQRIAELDERIAGIVRQNAEAEKRMAEMESRIGELQREREHAEQASRELETRILSVEKQRTKTQVEGEKAQDGLRRNSEERGKLLKELEKGRDLLEGLRPRVQALLEDRERNETLAAHIQTEVERLEGEGKKMEEEVHRLNIAVVRHNGEAQNLDYDIERSKKLLAEIEATITQRGVETEQAEADIRRLTEETAGLEQRLLEQLQEKEDKEAEKRRREEEFQALREALETKEKEVRQVRRDREEVSEKIHGLQMEITEIEHQVLTLRNHLWENFGIELEKLSCPDPFVLEEAEKGIEDMKRRIKNLGPVNIAALQEYEQQKARLDFLLQQREDLLSAESTLKETITKINETARQRFQEVFDQVRVNFRQTFSRFFQGGEADLRMAEGEDVLEAQIEILARPAGKQLRALDLLSGGEKALTAISLLFAMYEVKPSPFCILDEIDAPLDDANVERFTSALAEYAKKTQFVIVTHNKRTMRCAQAMYGVTMEEEGVSKLVSVKWEDEEVPQPAQVAAA
ncbi:chromosome segregation protein SMC [bacterium]|nr:chromosome segregation protein SMC [bacterium]